jgi:succinylglutamate desuccinylase
MMADDAHHLRCGPPATGDEMQISKDPRIANVVQIHGSAPGPHLVMFSGVHGDEVSGIHALEKLFFDLFTEKRVLRRGSLTLARANEQAMAAECRYVKHNLNRMFRAEYGPEIDRDSYEFRRAQELKSILDHCDYFLDFHSAPIAQEPFLVAEHMAVEFYARLGIPRIMTGWSRFSAGAIGGDAENYANAHGAKSATLESGSHFDKRSNDVAYRAAVSLLSSLEMLEEAETQVPAKAELFDMYAVVKKEHADFRYAGTVRNFERIPKGEAFAFANGKPITVAEDTYLLIPMQPEKTRIGEEVCYLGRKLAGDGA